MAKLLPHHTPVSSYGQGDLANVFRIRKGKLISRPDKETGVAERIRGNRIGAFGSDQADPVHQWPHPSNYLTANSQQIFAFIQRISESPSLYLNIFSCANVYVNNLITDRRKDVITKQGTFTFIEEAHQPFRKLFVSVELSCEPYSEDKADTFESLIINRCPFEQLAGKVIGLHSTSCLAKLVESSEIDAYLYRDIVRDCVIWTLKGHDIFYQQPIAVKCDDVFGYLYPENELQTKTAVFKIIKGTDEFLDFALLQYPEVELPATEKEHFSVDKNSIIKPITEEEYTNSIVSAELIQLRTREAALLQTAAGEKFKNQPLPANPMHDEDRGPLTI